MYSTKSFLQIKELELLLFGGALAEGEPMYEGESFGKAEIRFTARPLDSIRSKLTASPDNCESYFINRKTGEITYNEGN